MDGLCCVDRFMIIFLSLIVFALSVPTLVCIIECLLALRQGRVAKDVSSIKRPRIGVLIPANNEELLIADTIKAVLSHLVEGDRLLVVADNCSDLTCEIALGCGAEVIERNDLSHQGKGYALNAGIGAFAKNPPEILIAIDADCHVEQGTLETLAKTAMSLNGPVQAMYLMQSKHPAGYYELFGQFAWIVKNWVRPLGGSAIGMPCMLTGSGMAFPWDVINEAELANSHITEDLKLGLDFILKDVPIRFCPEVLVVSCFPDEQVDQKNQRRRWEHGYLDILFHYIPKLWRNAIKQRRFKLFAVSLDLMVPPLALLCLFMLLGLIITGIGFLFGYKLPFFLLVGIGVMLFGTLIVIRNRFAKKVIGLGQLLLFPFYVILKLPIYIDYIFGKETTWRDTKRSKN